MNILWDLWPVAVAVPAFYLINRFIIGRRLQGELKCSNPLHRAYARPRAVAFAVANVWRSIGIAVFLLFISITYMTMFINIWILLLSCLPFIVFAEMRLRRVQQEILTRLGAE